MQLGFWSGLLLLIKLLTPEPWRENIEASCHALSCTTRSPGQWEMGSWIGSTDALSLKSGNALPVRDCFERSFAIIQCHWLPKTPWVHTKVGVLAPIHNVCNSTSRSYGHKDIYNSWQGLPTLWKRTPKEHHESLERLHHWRCYCCFRKSNECHQEQ